MTDPDVLDARLALEALSEGASVTQQLQRAAEPLTVSEITRRSHSGYSNFEPCRPIASGRIRRAPLLHCASRTNATKRGFREAFRELCGPSREKLA